MPSKLPVRGIWVEIMWSVRNSPRRSCPRRFTGFRMMTRPGRKSPKWRQFCDRKRIGFSRPIAPCRKRLGQTERPLKIPEATRLKKRNKSCPVAPASNNEPHPQFNLSFGRSRWSADIDPRKTVVACAVKTTRGRTSSVPINDRKIN